MNLEYKSAVLFVKDIEKSKEFYIDLLKREVEVDFGTNIGFKDGFAIWQLDPKHVISQKYAEKTKGDGNRKEIYFETEDLDEIDEILKKEKIEYLHDINEESWGQRNIRVFDPDNHLIEIGENMRTFLKRFQDLGMSFEEISKRTFVPVEGVKEFLK